MQVFLAQPRGFCAGVTRAITIVERALEIYGAPIYVRHEIVHNKTVVRDLRERGAVFVDNLEDVPDGATVVFSAHGVPKMVSDYAQQRGFRVFDATCPLVKKVHREVCRMHAAGKKIIMIGHAGHPEVVGTMGQVDNGVLLVEKTDDVFSLPEARDEELAYVTQTTICADDSRSVIEALKKRWPAIHEPKQEDICYATTNRQLAVKNLAIRCDIVLVIGSVTSSNSNRLREVAERHGARAYLIDTADQLEYAWFDGVNTVGVTAGASAPESLVQNVIERLQREYHATEIETIDGEEENVAFPLPKGLWESDRTAARSTEQENN